MPFFPEDLQIMSFWCNFSNVVLQQWVFIVWLRVRVCWKGSMLNFSKKKIFEFFVTFFLLQFPLGFLVRVIWIWDVLGILSLNGPFSSIFRKIGHFQKDLEKPHSVTWCCHTAHLKGFYSYFNSKTEKSRSTILNPSNPRIRWGQNGGTAFFPFWN